MRKIKLKTHTFNPSLCIFYTEKALISMSLAHTQCLIVNYVD